MILIKGIAAALLRSTWPAEPAEQACQAAAHKDYMA
jgi:hypothetical protein